MNALFVCLLVYLGLGARAEESCKQIIKWCGNACTLGGGLQVKCLPGNEGLTADNCNRFYNRAVSKQAPAVSLDDAETDQTYTMIMLDADATNQPDGYYYLHWIVANIQGADFKRGDFKNAKTILQYRPPKPPKHTGTHRYMILAFRHEDPAGRLTEEIEDLKINRRMFYITTWLTGLPIRLCGPISGIQYRLNIDDKEA